VQGWINHWANRTNAQGTALLGASRLNFKTFLLQDFHVFRLFITRQNYRAFRLLCLVCWLSKLTTMALIVFEWLKRIEPNSTTFYDPSIRSQSVHPWASMSVFQWRQRQNFAYPFQVADDAMQMDVHKMLYPF